MSPCILITGGAGFIGCEIGKRLVGASIPVIAVDNMLPQVHPSGARPANLPTSVELIQADVRDAAFWDRFFLEHHPNVIYHLAAETGTGQSLLEASKHASVNVTGLTEMLDGLAWHSIAPEQFILSSSRAVYGEGAWVDPSGQLFYPGVRSHEMLASGQWDFLTANDDPAKPTSHDASRVHPRPTSVYGATKLAQEHELTAWAAAMGSRLSILRFQNVYGPGQSPFNSYTGIITLFHRQARAGATIEQAARVIAAYHGAPTPTICSKFRDGDVRWAVADASQMNANFGSFDVTSFENGSAAVADWLIDNGHI